MVTGNNEFWHNMPLAALTDNNGAGMLQFKAKPEAGKRCLMYELEKMSQCYVKAWQKAGVILPVV